jgi:methylated-DNA-[protein]-cysteine S-methyltransferase
MILFDTMPSPVGTLLLAAGDEGLTTLHFEARRHAPAQTHDWLPTDGGDTPPARTLTRARAQLEEYFAGARTTFDLPLAPRGTPFQLRVWTALREIPFGSTRGYAEIAQRLGLPNAARAVGAANGRNQIAIIVPCHRVIGANGSMTGFGGGIERKRWLLVHEGAVPLLL